MTERRKELARVDKIAVTRKEIIKKRLGNRYNGPGVTNSTDIRGGDEIR